MPNPCTPSCLMFYAYLIYLRFMQLSRMNDAHYPDTFILLTATQLRQHHVLTTTHASLTMITRLSVSKAFDNLLPGGAS